MTMDHGAEENEGEKCGDDDDDGDDDGYEGAGDDADVDGDRTTLATPFKILELLTGLAGGEPRTLEREGGAPTF